MAASAEAAAAKSASTSDTVSKDEKNTITNDLLKSSCNEASDITSSIASAGALCITEDQKKNNIYTVLETPLESADNLAQNNDGTNVISCARLSTTLVCGNGSTATKV